MGILTQAGLREESTHLEHIYATYAIRKGAELPTGKRSEQYSAKYPKITRLYGQLTIMDRTQEGYNITRRTTEHQR